VLFEIKNIHLIKPKQLKIKYKYLFSFLSPSFQLLCSFITLNQELFQKYKHFVKKGLIVFNINCFIIFIKYLLSEVYNEEIFAFIFIINFIFY